MDKDREGRALSKPGRKSGGGKHNLSDEERSLWEHAASNMRPLKQKKGRVHVGHEDTTEKPVRRPISPQKPGSKRSVDRSTLRPSTPQAQAKSAPPLSQLDRRKARKISTGRIEIEARVDLHGMRQSEAHLALRRFLLNAHAKGRRWVLVITGKGSRPRGSSEVGEYAGLRDDERGVLKRNVPRWLAEPELRAIVISFAAAAARHGGEGALYVQLRKGERAGSDD
jgi:DNA-nicking Smr family endonuclease